jgi:hypothetical protein
MECLWLHNKPTAEVHPGHMLTGPKEEEEEEATTYSYMTIFCFTLIHCVTYTTSIILVKAKGKFHTKRGHEGLEGEC